MCAVDTPPGKNISIHALREEGDVTWTFIILMSHAISIHALREEGDGKKQQQTALRWISIHALREEGDVGGDYKNTVTIVFLSTPSARRATCITRDT